ncbi:hypothetical protein GCM10020255_079650 [Rhodococcus baikonurensis]
MIVPADELFAGTDLTQIEDLLRQRVRSYRNTLQWDRRVLLDAFEMTHIARKVVGVGSVGTRAWMILMKGVDDGDPLILQVKEAQPSVLSGYVDGPTFKNEGERVVNGQRLMQATSDIFLGWERGPGLDEGEHDFYIRQLRDGKGSAVIEEMVPEGLELYGRLCARSSPMRTLAPPTGLRSPNTLVREPNSISRSENSRLPTPSATHAITPLC